MCRDRGSVASHDRTDRACRVRLSLSQLFDVSPFIYGPTAFLAHSSEWSSYLWIGFCPRSCFFGEEISKMPRKISGRNDLCPSVHMLVCRLFLFLSRLYAVSCLDLPYSDRDPYSQMCFDVSKNSYPVRMDPWGFSHLEYFSDHPLDHVHFLHINIIYKFDRNSRNVLQHS